MYMHGDLCSVRNGSCVYAGRLVFSKELKLCTWRLMFSEELKLCTWRLVVSEHTSIILYRHSLNSSTEHKAACRKLQQFLYDHKSACKYAASVQCLQ